jgi:hypothetical protein
MNIQITFRSKATLSGNGNEADCDVMINKLKAVTTIVIDQVHSLLPDGEYTLTVPDEPSSQWRQSKGRWERL